MLVTPPKKSSRSMSTACKRGRDERTDGKDGEKRRQKVHGFRRNCQGPRGRRTTVGESGESSVNSIRITLVYIRGQDSPRAIANAAARISTARRADYERSGGSMVPSLFPRSCYVVLDFLELLDGPV